MAIRIDGPTFLLACSVVWIGFPGLVAGGEIPVMPATVEVTKYTTGTSPDCDADGVPFGGGSGESDDPFLLCTSEHLNAIGEGTSYLDAHFSLGADIDMEGVEKFQMIGDHQNHFTGLFNGNGFRIENLSINTKYDDVMVSGLFGTIGKGGVVANLTLTDIELKTDSSSGVVGARNLGGLIEDVSVTGYVEAHSGFSGCIVAGNLDGGVIRRVEGECDVYSGRQGVGGFVGDNSALIVDSHIRGTVEQHAGHYAGGFVGLVGAAGVIKRSSSDVKLEMPSPGASAGGFVGANRGIITESYASGDVTARTHGVGGFVGANSGKIANCYATGDAVSFDRWVGGFLGQNQDEEARIINSYSTGYADGEAQVGGFGGHPRYIGDGNIEGGVWDKTTAGVSDPIGGDGQWSEIQALETGEFGNAQRFGWDFDEVWKIGEAPDGERRPIFQWQ